MVGWNMSDEPNFTLPPGITWNSVISTGAPVTVTMYSHAFAEKLDAPCTVCGGKLDDFNAEWRVPTCEACNRAADDADPVSKVGLWTEFTALFEGERYRFWTGEHFNLGPGWMCEELDRKLPRRVYSSQELTDVQVVEGSQKPPWAGDGLHGDHVQYTGKR